MTCHRWTDCVVGGLSAPVAGGVCGPCLEHVAAQTRLLPALYDDLAGDLMRWPQRPEPDRIAAGKAGSTLPLDAAVEALRRQMWWTVGVWETPVRAALGMGLPRRHRVRHRWVLRHGALLLSQHMHTLAGLAPLVGPFAGPGTTSRCDGFDAVRQLAALALAATRRLGLEPTPVRLPGGCPQCGAWSLRRTPPTTTVRCALCGYAMSYQQYGQSHTPALLAKIAQVNGQK